MAAQNQWSQRSTSHNAASLQLALVRVLNVALSPNGVNVAGTVQSVIGHANNRRSQNVG